MPLVTPERYAAPLIELPPLLGMMLSVGPPTSTSPNPPDVVVTTSCAFEMSATYVDTPLPPSPAPAFNPSTCMRPSLLRPPAPPENRHLGCDLDVRRTAADRDDAGNQQRRRRPRPCRRHARQQLATQRRLTPHALCVDDRRFAAHRDRLRDAANFHISVHGRRERPGQLDVFALHRAEAGER